MMEVKEVLPAPGMGATIIVGSDRYPATIVDVQGTVLLIQEDLATRVDNNGLSESQIYSYKENSTARVQLFTKRKTGVYVQKGESLHNGHRLHIGEREMYQNPSF